jgi:hypothetical protein
MRGFSVLRGAVIGLAAAFLQFGTANADGQIATPILLLSNDTDQVLCIVNNVSNAPVTVRVQILGVVSGSSTDTCTLAVNDRGGCQVPFFGAGRCRVLINGATNEQVRDRVRAVMFTRAITAPFAIEAVVQAN